MFEHCDSTKKFGSKLCCVENHQQKTQKWKWTKILRTDSVHMQVRLNCEWYMIKYKLIKTFSLRNFCAISATSLTLKPATLNDFNNNKNKYATKSMKHTKINSCNSILLRKTKENVHKNETWIFTLDMYVAETNKKWWIV